MAMFQLADPAKVSSSDEHFGGPFSELTFAYITVESYMDMDDDTEF